MGLSNAETIICHAIESARDELIETADRIHKFSEIGYQEHKSSQLLASRLESHGLQVKRHVADLETAFEASLEGGRPGPRIGILAEYDALPGLGHA